MKALQIYDFAMIAGGSFPLLVSGSYFRILSCTGNVSVTGDTWGKLGPINKGQGLENSLYNRLIIKDESGAINTGTILVSDANFIDQTLYGAVSLSGAVDISTTSQNLIRRPESATAFFSDLSAMTANAPLTIFSAGSNPNGAILLSAQISVLDTASNIQCFISKATAPSAVNDGAVYLMTRLNIVSASNAFSGDLTTPQFIPAGQGLFFIGNAACSVGTNNFRACRYKLL